MSSCPHQYEKGVVYHSFFVLIRVWGSADIILYLGVDKPEGPSVVPNVVGLSAEKANKAITDAGLIMRVTGAASSDSGNVFVISQTEEAGTQVEAGTVMTVQLGDTSVRD